MALDTNVDRVVAGGAGGHLAQRRIRRETSTMTTRSTSGRHHTGLAQRAGLALGALAIAALAIGCITPSDPRLDDESRHDVRIVRVIDGSAKSAVYRRG
jgi:hypothetical protein